MSPSATSIFAQAEQEVYQACLEWPLWLVLRWHQLARAESGLASSDAAAAPTADLFTLEDAHDPEPAHR
jgi:hypothetical protein